MTGVLDYICAYTFAFFADNALWQFNSPSVIRSIIVMSSFQGPTLVSSTKTIVKEKKKLQRKILCDSLNADDKKKKYVENINDLKEIPPAVDDIERRTMDMFEEMKSACQLLLCGMNE